MWASCFENSNYYDLYKEYEQLVDAYRWSITEIRQLSYRERKHWVERYLHKLELEYDRMHQANNTNQTVVRSVGQEVTFNGMRYR